MVYFPIIDEQSLTKDYHELWKKKYVKHDSIYSNRKYKARQKNITFNLLYDEYISLERPKNCPLLGIKLNYDNKVTSDNSPVLDRVDNSKGYELNNVWIISSRANRIKNDATAGELMKIALNLQKKIRGVK